MTEKSPTACPPTVLPIIDLTPFLPTPTALYPTPEAHLVAKLTTAAALNCACRDVGFFYLTGHGIPEKLHRTVLQEARSWFLNASEEDKKAIKRWDVGKGLGRAGDGARGYQRVGENITGGMKDWHEAIDYYRPVPPAAPPYAPIHGPNPWPSPQTYPTFQPTFESYIESCLSLGHALLRALSLALHPSPPKEDLFTGFLHSPFWVMRIIGYPPLSTSPNDGGVSCGEHTDYGCVTLLLADNTRGALQVRDKDGGWINADPLEGAYVVNIGDMLERWTNGLWMSTRHRVIHGGENYRVSVPFFFEPDWVARIKPLECCLAQTGGVPKYDEVVYGEHLLSKVLGNFYDDTSTASRY
ncbi:hypothetical protein EV426DRAFT_564175 [Tirmania nivea]|nr:hypothetical protein EV426DRAFT_564175 [Tirmania nivea]